MLNDTVLEAFMTGFFGYGNPEAPLWFIAKEEGGGKSESEIGARIGAWDQRGRREIEDLREFCAATSHENLTKYSSAPWRPVDTWIGMVAYQLGREGVYDPTAIHRYEQREWLLRGGNNCLLNLFPLPSPTTRHWKYAPWSNIPFLRSRATYKRELREARITALRELVTRHRPKTVVFCSVDAEYKSCWGQIQDGIDGIEFVTIIHPSRSAANAKASTRGSVPMAHSEKKAFFEVLWRELQALPEYRAYRLQTNLATTADNYKRLHSLKGDQFHVSFVYGEQGPNGGEPSPSLHEEPFRLEYTLQGGGKRLFDRIRANRSGIPPDLERQLTWHRLDDNTNRSIIALYYDGEDNDLRRREWVIENAKPFIDELSKFA